jgi:hypothetical protein
VKYSEAAALEARLAAIDAASKADAEDLAKMRDGTKLTRSGLVEIIKHQQQDIEKLQSRIVELEGSGQRELHLHAEQWLRRHSVPKDCEHEFSGHNQPFGPVCKKCRWNRDTIVRAQVYGAYLALASLSEGLR